MEHLKKTPPKNKPKPRQNFGVHFEALNINMEHYLPFLKYIVHSDPLSVNIVSLMKSEICCL